jgi:hypothetical protein
MLEIQIAEIDARAQQGTEGTMLTLLIEAGGEEEAGFGERERGIGHMGLVWGRME